MKQLLTVLFLLSVAGGLYLKFFYDVPDAEEQINFFVSWFLVIVGLAGFLITIFWETPRPPRNTDHA